MYSKKPGKATRKYKKARCCKGKLHSPGESLSIKVRELLYFMFDNFRSILKTCHTARKFFHRLFCIPKWIYLIPDTFKFYKENIAELPYICIASLPPTQPHTLFALAIHSFNKHQSGNSGKYYTALPAFMEFRFSLRLSHQGCVALTNVGNSRMVAWENTFPSASQTFCFVDLN